MSWVFVILLVVAVPLYALMSANAVSYGKSDAAGNGMAMAFAAIFGMVLWIVMLVLLLMARRGMTDWLAICVFIALPLAPILAIVAVARGWSRYAPVLAPLPFLAIAIWARLA